MHTTAQTAETPADQGKRGRCFQRRWRRKLAAVIALIILGAGLSGIVELQKRYRIADIISDEAEWDLRDASSQDKEK